MAEVIAVIQTRRSGNIHGVLYSYQSVFKELEYFGSDLLALSSERLPLMPFSFITINNVTGSSTTECVQLALFVTAEAWTSFY